MRLVATLLSVAGGFGCAALGRHWLAQAARHAEVGIVSGALGPDLGGLKLTAAAMLLACLAALVGAALTYAERGRRAGIILLVGGIAPGLVDPRAFVVTCVLVLAGILAFEVQLTRCPRPAAGRCSIPSLG